MSLGGLLFAAGYDRLMAASERGGLARHRQALLAGATGRVLEVGGGTGANLPYYGRSVSELVIAEPDPFMRRRLACRLRGYPIPAEVLGATAEALPCASGSFDCAVVTLVLCTTADPQRALAEVRRVLKPGGRLYFIEHVRSEDRAIARWQDRLRAPWAFLARGCQCNRSTLEHLRATGFTVTALGRDGLPRAPFFVRPLVIGVAARS